MQTNRTGFALPNKYLPIALAALAFATFGAAPALAKHHHHPVAAASSSALYNQAPDSFGDVQVSPEREAALRQCNAEMQKFSDSAWETAKSAAYGTCMTDHGQTP